jgi:phenylacetate-CoA ligase
LVNEVLERDYWSREQWHNWQAERLAKVLRIAATKVPYYREMWAKAGGLREGRWEDLKNWPILKKEAVRANPQAFLVDDCNPREMYCDKTSGTSGTPLKIWSSRDTIQAWYALWEARIRMWNEVSRLDRWAILGGQQVVRGDTKRSPFWVSNWPMRQLYLSANHISKDNALAYYQAIERFQPSHLITYSSSAAALAHELLKADRKCTSIKVVVTNAEPLLPGQRHVIRQALAPEVRESYGMGEAVAGASECSHGRLHIWPEAGYVEVVEDLNEQPISGSKVGRLVCTSLLNLEMPLIRYEVGDRSSPPCWKCDCPCGRRLPVVQGIEGRTNDLLTTKDGRKVFWVNPVFYELPIAEAQVIQESLDEVCVRVIPAEGFSFETERTITARLHARLGDVQVRIKRVERIDRGANGKLRAVISNLTSGGATRVG